MSFSKGLLLSFVPPKKNFTIGTDSLSSGESSLANLAIFICLNLYLNSRFIFLDEIDCNLDSENLGRYIEFL